MDQPQAPQVPAHVPLMTLERFAELSGLTVDTVYGHIRRGYLPAVKVGRYRLVNIALLQTQCLQGEDWA